MAKKMTLDTLATRIENALETAKEEIHSFEEKRVNNAGTRVRKAFQEIATLAKDGRKLVTTIKEDRKAEKEAAASSKKTKKAKR